MSNMKKNTYTLLGILAVLVVVAIFLMNRPGETNISAENSSFLIPVDSLAVDKIELNSPKGKVTLEKKGSEWFLTDPVNYRADQASVASVINQSKHLIVKEIVSSNPGKQSIFQVDSTGTAVTIYQNGRQHAQFVVGKPGQNYSETYVRKERSNDVVVVQGALTYSFNKAAKDWRDKTVSNVPKETIKEIAYQYSGEKFSLVMKDSVWMIGNDKAKSAEVTSLLSAVSNIQADDFIDTTISPAPKIAATITVGGVQIRLSEAKEKDNYYAQTSNSPQWYELQGWRAKQILKHKKDLI